MINYLSGALLAPWLFLGRLSEDMAVESMIRKLQCHHEKHGAPGDAYALGQRLAAPVLEVASRLAGEAKGSHGGTQFDELCAQHNWLQWRVIAGWEESGSKDDAAQEAYDSGVLSLAKRALLLGERVVDRSFFTDPIPEEDRTRHNEMYVRLESAMIDNLIRASQWPREQVSALDAKIAELAKTDAFDRSNAIGKLLEGDGFDACRTYKEFLHLTLADRGIGEWVDSEVEKHGAAETCFVVGYHTDRIRFGILLSAAEALGYGQVPDELFELRADTQHLGPNLAAYLLAFVRREAKKTSIGKAAVESIKVLRRAVISQGPNLTDERLFAVAAAELCMGFPSEQCDRIMYAIRGTEGFQRWAERDVSKKAILQSYEDTRARICELLTEKHR